MTRPPIADPTPPADSRAHPDPRPPNPPTPPTAGTHNVLLFGSGAREHAIAWKLRQSPLLGALFTDAPAHPGLGALAGPAAIPWSRKDHYELSKFAAAERIGLAVIGPEEPLADGLTDVLLGTDSMGDAGLAGVVLGGGRRPGSTSGGLAPVPYVFGPTRAAARLESDKVFSKQLMRDALVPTAEGRSFSEASAAVSYLESRTEPMVIKAAGLCKGKGVFLPDTLDQARAVVHRLMTERALGPAGATVVIEERLRGREVSVFAVTDGRTLVVLDPCQDHKRLLDGARGPNTGGMGALCPTPAIDERSLARVEREVLVPTIDALRRQGIEYRGVLYAGLMLTHAGPKALEFNVRFGDPECQALLVRMRGDLLHMMLAASGALGPGALERADLSTEPGAAVCLVMAAPGYPDAPRTGVPIAGIDRAEAVPGVRVFVAAARRDESGTLRSTGGRVLSITAVGADRHEARQRAYQAAKAIDFPGALLRTDIGTDIAG
ncbi:MAG: phosphoribosylamine--glycine ligase [Planctomyces sp.]|nr:phosphoribosylamine--glycine ligase [Planctomyces sp.]